MYRDKYCHFKNYRVIDNLTMDKAREIGFGFFIENYSAPKTLLTANNIIASIDNGLEIGHSYFCNTEGCEDFAKWWDDICEYELFPYIREICFDDTEKCEQICNILR